MKPILVLASALVLSVATSLIVVRLAETPPVQAGAGASAEDLARISRDIAESRSREEALAKSIEGLRADLAGRSREDGRIPIGDIEAAVARALREQGGSPATPDPAAAEAQAKARASSDVRATFEKLLAQGLSFEDAQKIWKSAVEAGQLDELVALFEARARDNPNSAQAQLDLGRAYLQKVFKAGGGPEAGVWATKADKSFDAALAIDDHAWDARFSKAVSLSFWPPVFGKQNEAIKHFEILTEQQGQVPAQPQFAQTWLLLGNMYQQIGQPDKALAAWQHGHDLFPNDTQLQQQIANAQGH
jgi:tetratricopeptide (TPR) repeat protein